MASGFESVINEMMAELAQQRESMTRLQQSIASVTGSATAPKRQLSVEVDSQGAITELKFLNQAYRSMSGAELASLIVETIREAQRDARTRLAEQVGSVGMAGAEIDDVLNGEIDWGTAFTDAMSVPKSFLDLLQRPPTDLLDGVDIEAVARDLGEGDAATGGNQQPGANK